MKKNKKQLLKILLAVFRYFLGNYFQKFTYFYHPNLSDVVCNFQVIDTNIQKAFWTFLSFTI